MARGFPLHTPPPSHTQPPSASPSPTPSSDSLGGPLRAIHPVHDNATNTLANAMPAPPQPIPVPVPVTVLPITSPTPTMSPPKLSMGDKSVTPHVLTRAQSMPPVEDRENVPVDRVQRISYVLPVADNVNGVDDGYRCVGGEVELNGRHNGVYKTCVVLHMPTTTTIVIKHTHSSGGASMGEKLWQAKTTSATTSSAPSTPAQHAATQSATHQTLAKFRSPMSPFPTTTHPPLCKQRKCLVNCSSKVCVCWGVVVVWRLVHGDVVRRVW